MTAISVRTLRPKPNSSHAFSSVSMCLSLQFTPTPKPPPSSLLPSRFTDCSYTLGPGAHVLAWLIRLEFRRCSVVSALLPVPRFTLSLSDSLPFASLSPLLFYRFALFFIAFTYLCPLPPPCLLLLNCCFSPLVRTYSHIHRRASARNAVAFTGSTRMRARWVGVARYLFPACLCCYLLLP